DGGYRGTWLLKADTIFIEYDMGTVYEGDCQQSCFDGDILSAYGDLGSWSGCVI
ncbi:MAG: hypothetical protein HN348_35100, partial [Proteobacteria bacterium]|nr:hypothetical protein [Pseudomonadota bacterium]